MMRFGFGRRRASSIAFADPAPAGDAPVLGALATSRTSAPAGSGIYFNALNTTCSVVTYAFHDVTYFFDYDDAGSGTFTVTGESKNTKMGPSVGTHVYLTPDTYNPTVYARAGVPWPGAGAFVQSGKVIWDGGKTWQANTAFTAGASRAADAANWTEIAATYLQSSTAALGPITITDPDTVYAATTYVLATDGVFTGAPSGTQVASIAAARTAAGGSLNGCRLLLKRGQAFGALSIGGGAVVEDDTYAAAWGTGDRPRVVSLTWPGTSNNNRWAQRCVVRDIEVDQTITLDVSGRHITLHNVLTNRDLDTAGIGTVTARVEIGGGTKFYASSGGTSAAEVYWPEYIVLSDVYARGDTGNDATPNVLVTMAARNSAFIGCDFDEADEHTLRMFGSYGCLLSDSRFGGQSYADNTATTPHTSLRVAIKWQSGGLMDYADTALESLEPKSSMNAIVDCIVGHADMLGSFSMGAAPENGQSVQIIEDLAMWRPHFIPGPNTNTCFEGIGRRMSMHGGTVEGGGAVFGNCFTVAEMEARHTSNPSGYSAYPDLITAGAGLGWLHELEPMA